MINGFPTPTAITRRGFLRRAGAMLGAGVLARPLLLAAQEAPPSPPRGSLRFAFLTDLHLMQNDNLHSAEGIARCLKAVEALSPRPEFILCGGDLTHESPNLELNAAEELLDQFQKIWADHTSLPVHYTFGNHDLAGTRNTAADKTDPRYGKGLYRQRLRLERDFYTFEAGGWRFVVLDDILPLPDGGYLGEFPEEQLAFLRAELARSPQTPTMLCGHIPTISAVPLMMELGKTVGMNIEISHSMMATNPQALFKCLAGANVKAVLAGHLHHLEQVDLDGISYINCGAVCGNWWKGTQRGCPEGFMVFDLQPDGQFTSAYQAYGWKADGGA